MRGWGPVDIMILIIMVSRSHTHKDIANVLKRSPKAITTKLATKKIKGIWSTGSFFEAVGAEYSSWQWNSWEREAKYKINEYDNRRS